MGAVLLADLRTEAGKTQDEVAAALRISLSTVHRHENSKSKLTWIHREAYARYYRVRPEQIEQPDKVAA